MFQSPEHLFSWGAGSRKKPQSCDGWGREGARGALFCVLRCLKRHELRTAHFTHDQDPLVIHICLLKRTNSEKEVLIPSLWEQDLKKHYTVVSTGLCSIFNVYNCSCLKLKGQKQEMVFTIPDVSRIQNKNFKFFWFCSNFGRIYWRERHDFSTFFESIFNQVRWHMY